MESLKNVKMRGEFEVMWGIRELGMCEVVRGGKGGFVIKVGVVWKICVG